MGDVNLEIKLSNLDERVIKIEESGGGSGGDGYITSVSNDFNVVNKKLSLSNDVTTKLSKIDTTDNLSVELDKKIDKPASATNGQVLTYNGTSNEWEAQDSKGGADDTSIISDAYDESKSYVAGEYCIYDNALWKALGSSQGTTPTEGTLWTKVSVGSELSALTDSKNESLELLLDKITSTSKVNYTVKDITQYRYLLCVGQSSDCINTQLIPVSIFITDTVNKFAFISGNYGAITEYHSRFNIWYVSNTEIKVEIINKKYTGTLWVYGIK